MLDAVIVGGGLAGLSAAYALRGRETVLLEKQAYLGGRVHTRRFEGIAYDMGAVLAYDPRALPFGFRPPAPFLERGRLGLYHRGRTWYGRTVLETTSGALATEEAEAARSFAEGRLELAGLPPSSRAVVNAFFRTIHPGEIEEYARERHRDAFVRHVPAHYPDGNVGVVHALRERSTAEIRTGVEVQAIARGPEGVTVSCLQDGRPLSLEARAAIIATPAPVARRLLTTLPPETARYIDAVRYGAFTVAAIGVEDIRFEDFAYVVSPELAVNTIYKLGFPDSPITVLIGYFCDRASQSVSKLEDTDVVERLRGAVCETGVAELRSQDVVFSDVVRWPQGGTIVSPELRERWSPGLVAPEEGIFLAGDYLWRDFPYGTEPAIRSGVEAGQRAMGFLGA